MVRFILHYPELLRRYPNFDFSDDFKSEFIHVYPCKNSFLVAYLCAIRGTRPPSPREVNSRGSFPAVGRFAPSGLPSLFPRLIEMIRIDDPARVSARFQIILRPSICRFIMAGIRTTKEPERESKGEDKVKDEDEKRRRKTKKDSKCLVC